MGLYSWSVFSDEFGCLDAMNKSSKDEETTSVWLVGHPFLINIMVVSEVEITRGMHVASQGFSSMPGVV